MRRRRRYWLAGMRAVHGGWQGRGRRAGSLALAFLLGAAFGCGNEPPAPHRGPIVLITLDALRADVVGFLGGPPGLTPHLDALAAEADWAEPAVAASSWTVPSMASLFTGLQPWRHGSWHGERAELAQSLDTLPEVLLRLGFHTVAYRSNGWLTAGLGYRQGFEEFLDLFGGDPPLERRLSRLDGGPWFVWVHAVFPHAPYVRRKSLFERLEKVPAGLPERVETAELERFFDPHVEMPADLRARWWTLYELNVAFADELVGRLLDAIRASGHWDDTLVAVTSDHGEEFGESGQSAHGGNLDRVLIEVPLLIKLPRGLGRSLTPRAEVGNLRLFATLLDAAGGTVPAGVEPSLFVDDERPALSELYRMGTRNRFSLVDGGEQVIWRASFAAPEPEFYTARRFNITRDRADVPSEPPWDIMGRIRTAFAATPPLSGSGPVEVTSVSWVEGHSQRRLDRGSPRAQALRAAWVERNGPEQVPSERGGRRVEFTPEERERLRALGYVVP